MSSTRDSAARPETRPDSRRRSDFDQRSFEAFAPRDFTSSLALAIGFRDWHYRTLAVAALGLAKGDRVVEIGCGTGRNFPLLERAVGTSGTIIGVDIADAMLARSRSRAERCGWSNVELVRSDAAAYEFPGDLDGVLATYALTVVPEYDRVIERACRALKNGRRIAVLDQRPPSGLARAAIPILNLLSRPFSYSRTLHERGLWESIRMHAGNVQVDDYYFGFVYLAVGEKHATTADGRTRYAL